MRSSLRAHGQYRSLVVRKLPGSYQILCGNHTAKGLKAEGYTEARCELIECSDVDAVKINLGDNRWSDLSDNDDEALMSLLEGLEGDYDGTGYDAGDLEALYESEDTPALDWREEGDPDTQMPDSSENPALADRFLIPPFDVLDARTGWWKERKRRWLDLGITSSDGREESLLATSKVRTDPDFYDKKDALERKLGKKLTSAEAEAQLYGADDREYTVGTSVFDPVLCELAYRWYSAVGSTVLDPFSGGSVRGLMASMLGRVYLGNDLSEKQVAANIDACKDFADRKLLGPTPSWSVGDSAQWVPPEQGDFMFTCPPYFDLERYSDDPTDLSTMDYDGFVDAYSRIIKETSDALRMHRFAVIVTGDARDKRGDLRDMRRVTAEAADAAGLHLVSAGILLTPVGSVKISAGRNFLAGGVLGRVHQDVMVFCRGDRKKAAAWRGEVDMQDPEALDV